MVFRGPKLCMFQPQTTVLALWTLESQNILGLARIVAHEVRSLGVYPSCIQIGMFHLRHAKTANRDLQSNGEEWWCGVSTYPHGDLKIHFLACRLSCMPCPAPSTKYKEPMHGVEKPISLQLLLNVSGMPTTMSAYVRT